MAEKKQSVVRLWLQGKRATEIASELGISRARVYQLLAEARKERAYSVHVQVKDAHGQDITDIATYLRRALWEAGVGTHKSEEP